MPTPERELSPASPAHASEPRTPRRSPGTSPRRRIAAACRRHSSGSISAIRSAACTISSTSSQMNPVTPSSITSGTDPRRSAMTGCAGGQGLDHDQAERLRPVAGEQRGPCTGVELGLLVLLDLPDEVDAVAHVGLDLLLVVVLVERVDLGGHAERQPRPASDLDRRERALLLGDATDEGEVAVGVVRHVAVRREVEPVVDRRRPREVEVRHRPPLVVADRDQRHRCRSAAAGPGGSRGRAGRASSGRWVLSREPREGVGPDVEVGVHDVELVAAARRARPASAGAGAGARFDQLLATEPRAQTARRTPPASRPSPTSRARTGSPRDPAPPGRRTAWRSPARSRRRRPAGRPRRAERPARSSRRRGVGERAADAPVGRSGSGLGGRRRADSGTGVPSGRGRSAVAGRTLPARPRRRRHRSPTVRARHFEHGAHAGSLPDPPWPSPGLTFAAPAGQVPTAPARALPLTPEVTCIWPGVVQSGGMSELHLSAGTVPDQRTPRPRHRGRPQLRDQRRDRRHVRPDPRLGLRRPAPPEPAADDRHRRSGRAAGRQHAHAVVRRGRLARASRRSTGDDQRATRGRAVRATSRRSW